MSFLNFNYRKERKEYPIGARVRILGNKKEGIIIGHIRKDSPQKDFLILVRDALDETEKFQWLHTNEVEKVEDT